MEGSMVLPGSAYQLPWYLWDGASDEYITLSHLFRLFRRYSSWNNRNPWNPVDFFYIYFTLYCIIPDGPIIKFTTGIPRIYPDSFLPGITGATRPHGNQCSWNNRNARASTSKIIVCGKTRTLNLCTTHQIPCLATQLWHHCKSLCV